MYAGNAFSKVTRWVELNWARLTSHQTHYRSYRGRVLRVKRPNQQCQSTEERARWVAIIWYDCHKSRPQQNIHFSQTVRWISTAHNSIIRSNQHDLLTSGCILSWHLQLSLKPKIICQTDRLLMSPVNECAVNSCGFWLLTSLLITK